MYFFKCIRFISCLLILNLSHGHCEKVSTAFAPTVLPTFERYVEKAMAEWGAPGVAVGIVKDGKVVYTKAFGVREVGTDKKVDEHTVFQIASLSKNMLAHLMVKLDQEGKLSLDDPVINYIPEFFVGNPEVTKTFTIRDLISHRSGLPSFSGDSLWYVGFSKDELIRGMSKIPLKETPRQKYRYQNQLFGMASLIAEKVTGKKMEILYKEYFFDPLGMKTASVGMDAIHPPFSLTSLLGSKNTNVAHPHNERDGAAYKLEFSPLIYVFSGSTGVNLSVMDYLKWLEFMLNKGTYQGKTLIDEAHYKQLMTPHVVCKMRPDDPQFPHERYSDTSYGMGFFMSLYGEGVKKVQTYGHLGAFYGVRSLMMIAPSENLGIIVLSNYGSNRVSLLPEALINKFMDLYLGLSDIDWSSKIRNNFMDNRMRYKRHKAVERAQNPAPAKALDKYEGTYTNDLYGIMTITAEGDHLVLHYRDKKVAMKHFNGDQFYFPGHELSGAFCESDVGYMYFGSKTKGVFDLMQIPSLLNEGATEGLFERVKEGQ